MTAPSPLDCVLEALDGVKPRADGSFKARCPCGENHSHGDRTPSLSVRAGDDGRVLLSCFVGCAPEQIVARLGLAMRDLFPPREEAARANGHGSQRRTDPRPRTQQQDREDKPPKRKIGEQRWRIPDPSGHVAAVHVRTDYDDGSKDLKWERPDGTPGLGGLSSKDVPLYGIHERQPGQPTIVGEGEPARDALAPVAAELGVCVVATVTGASAVPNDDALRPLLDGRVLLWPDSDPPGEAHMDRLHRRLRELGLQKGNISRLAWPGATPGAGDDAADFVRRGGTATELDHLVKTARSWGETDRGSTKTERRVRFVTARQFGRETPPQTVFVDGQFVPVGGITKIDGPPKKAGKTTFVTHMIGAVLDGADFLGKPTKRGPVVLLSEQGGTSLREAFGRAGLLERDDLHLALYRDMAGFAWPDVVADAVDLAEEVGAVLLVVDTLPACSGVRGDDENSAGRALEALEPLQVAADAHRLGVVVSFHDRKGGGEVGDSGRGSTAYAGAVDVILHITKPGGNFDPAIRKIEALSRFEATPPELYVQLTEAGYVSLGSQDDVVSAALARALPDVLPDSEEAAKRIESVKDKDTEETVERGLRDDLAAAGVQVARSTLDAELKRWVAGGYAGQTGGAKRGSPRRYWLIAMPPDGFFRPKPTGASEERNASGSPSEASHPSEPVGTTEKHSSDAPSPSEETNETVGADTSHAEILSSDAPVGYGGRNNGNGELGAWESAARVAL